MGQLSGFMINVRLAEMRSACCPSTQDVGFETLRLGKLQPAVGAIGPTPVHAILMQQGGVINRSGAQILSECTLPYRSPDGVQNADIKTWNPHRAAALCQRLLSPTTTPYLSLRRKGARLPEVSRPGKHFARLSHTRKFSMPAGLRESSTPVPTEPFDEDDASMPQPAVGKDAQDHKWAWCRQKIIWLYWEQNLPLKQVQEIMRREDGLNATQKQYKGRFQKWGIRKNISVRKAREIASAGGTASDFWPGLRQHTYERRVARHLKNDARNHTCNQHVHPSRPEGSSNVMQHQMVPSPARLSAPHNLENLEKTLYDAEIYVQYTMSPGRTSWLASRAELGEDDRFFPLFIGGLESLSRDYETDRAFADIIKAFEHLKGLVTLDDAAIYHRLVARFSSFEQYPRSEVCFQVCCLLTGCLRATYLDVHGPSHPLNRVWTSHIEMLESRPETGFFDHYLESFRTLGRKLYGSRNSLNIGSIDLAKYVTSSFREWDEEALRHGLADSAFKATPAPMAQEIRLALTELLLQQGTAEEAAHLLGEARALKRLDSADDVDRVFWLSELEWRAGNADGSFALLRDALELADYHQIRPGPAGGPREEEDRLSSWHILHTLIFRLNLMGRKQENAEAWERAAPMVAARRDRKPFVLHLTTSDFEFDLDTRFCSLAMTD